jgi:hypothetical protein
MLGFRNPWNGARFIKNTPPNIRICEGMLNPPDGGAGKDLEQRC